MGRAGNERGTNAEARVLRLVRESSCSWIEGARRASSDEDRRGIDVVVESDVGKLYLQVKASKAGARKHAVTRNGAGPPVEVVVARSGDSDETVRGRALAALSRLRKEFQARRSTS